MTEEETEKAQATRDAALWASVTLLVAHCGGDINKATEAQKQTSPPTSPRGSSRAETTNETNGLDLRPVQA